MDGSRATGSSGSGVGKINEVKYRAAITKVGNFIIENGKVPSRDSASEAERKLLYSLQGLRRRFRLGHLKRTHAVMALEAGVTLVAREEASVTLNRLDEFYTEKKDEEGEEEQEDSQSL